jgi:hypothetical protein
MPSMTGGTGMAEIKKAAPAKSKGTFMMFDADTDAADIVATFREYLLRKWLHCIISAVFVISRITGNKV